MGKRASGPAEDEILAQLISACNVELLQRLDLVEHISDEAQTTYDDRVDNIDAICDSTRAEQEAALNVTASSSSELIPAWLESELHDTVLAACDLPYEFTRLNFVEWTVRDANKARYNYLIRWRDVEETCELADTRRQVRDSRISQGVEIFETPEESDHLDRLIAACERNVDDRVVAVELELESERERLIALQEEKRRIAAEEERIRREQAAEEERIRREQAAEEERIRREQAAEEARRQAAIERAQNTVWANDLFVAYAGNEIAAAAKYESRRLWVIGLIADVKEKNIWFSDDELSVELVSNWAGLELWSVTCDVPDNRANRAIFESLEIWTYLTVSGVNKNGPSFRNFGLDDCYVVLDS